MITLYQRTDCPFCWKVRLALSELERDYQTVETELGQRHPDVEQLSPVGTVPVLLDDATVIWESSVILDYLDARYAAHRLLPGEAVAQAQVRLLQAYSDKVVGACLRPVVFEKRSRPESEWDQQVIADGEDQWRNCLSYLERHLNDRVFFGPDFSAADCALAARFGVAEAYGMSTGEDFPALQAWFARVSERESWRAAYPGKFVGR